MLSSYRLKITQPSSLMIRGACKGLKLGLLSYLDMQGWRFKMIKT